MSELDRALAEISAIRSQMARIADFRGYGPATFAVTGLMAAAVALGQSVWLPDPRAAIPSYLGLWMATAAASVAIIGVEMVRRTFRLHSILAGDMVRSAVEQFVPAALAGAAMTGVIVRFAPEARWMLPGLWQIAFGLGVFASCRFLPRGMGFVGAWYLAAGLACLALASGPHAFSPWAMGLPFGVGQMMVALVLRLAAGGIDEQA